LEGASDPSWHVVVICYHLLAILFGGEGDIVDGHLMDNLEQIKLDKAIAYAMLIIGDYSSYLLTISIKIPRRLEVETEKL
jgi:hypothetical protein